MGHHQSAIYAGTFDPFTNGHLNIIERALKVFGHVVILLAKSPKKIPLFSIGQREQMLTQLFKSDDRVSVDIFDGLVVDYAKDKKIHTLIRGLRPTGDFEIEFQMSSMNNKLFNDIETVFFMTEGEHYFISSTLVREIFDHGGDISQFVPRAVLDFIKKS